MKRQKLTFIALIAASACAQTNPQPTPPAEFRPESAGAFMRQIGSDQVKLWSSPFRMNRKQALGLALPIAGVTAALIASDRRISGALPNTPDQIAVSRDISRAGSLYTLTAAVGIPWMVGAFTKNEAAMSAGATTGRALVNATAITYGLKAVFWRDRPVQGNGNGNFWGGGDGFPSGHALTTFAMATALASNPRVPKWLKVTSYVAATAVSLSRISGRKHFAADVFAGASLGYLVGRQAAGLPPIGR